MQHIHNRSSQQCSLPMSGDAGLQGFHPGMPGRAFERAAFSKAADVVAADTAEAFNSAEVAAMAARTPAAEWVSRVSRLAGLSK